MCFALHALDLFQNLASCQHFRAWGFGTRPLMCVDVNYASSVYFVVVNSAFRRGSNSRLFLCCTYSTDRSSSRSRPRKIPPVLPSRNMTGLLSVSETHTHTHWKINYRTFNNNNTTFILYSAFKSCFLIHSLLQIVSCECTTARVGGARPSTIDAWQCFLLDIPDYIKEWLLCSCCPSLSPSLPFDWTLRCWVCVCCFVLLYFECCVVLCVKKLKKKCCFLKRTLHKSFTRRQTQPYRTMHCKYNKR